MELAFWKMHGIGNDYVLVNCLEQTIENPEKAAVLLSDRHTGIGSDGLILVEPSLPRCAETAYAVSGNMCMITG